jgi:hypothetical protein
MDIAMNMSDRQISPFKTVNNMRIYSTNIIILVIEIFSPRLGIYMIVCDSIF